MIVTKAVALVEDVEASDEYPNGAFEVILSAATLDRDGEIIDSRAFDPLPDHIPFDIDHGMTVMTTIGSGTPSYNDQGQLVVKGGYASTALAQDVRTLVSEGHVRTTSVTFMAADREKDEKGVTHVKSAELLNGTFTPVPSNREAVVLSSKSLQALTRVEDALAEETNPEAKSAAIVPENAKAIVGSLEAQRDRVSDALSDAYPRLYFYIRGVLSDSVVFDVWDDECTSYQQTYTDDGSVVTLTGTPVEVDVMEIVTPDADAATEPDEGLKSASVTPDSDTEETASKAAETAATDEKVAAISTAKDADEGSVVSLALIEFETQLQIG